MVGHGISLFQGSWWFSNGKMEAGSGGPLCGLPGRTADNGCSDLWQLHVDRRESAEEAGWVSQLQMANLQYKYGTTEGRRGTETPKRVDVDVMILPRLLISAPNLVND